MMCLRLSLKDSLDSLNDVLVVSHSLVDVDPLNDVLALVESLTLVDVESLNDVLALESLTLVDVDSLMMCLYLLNHSRLLMLLST